MSANVYVLLIMTYYMCVCACVVFHALLLIHVSHIHVLIILLTNRVHPTRDNPALAPLRGIVADMVVEAIVDDPR